MYSKFSGGFRIIIERATKEPQYRGISLAGMYGPAQPMHMSTLLGMTQTAAPLAESTPMTQSSQMPTISNRIPSVRNIVELTPNEQVRTEYLERQMRQMGSISRLPSDMPSLEDELVQSQDRQRKETMSEEEYNRNNSQQPEGTVVPDNLQERVQNYCLENKVKRKHEWESHRIALERMRDSKEQQQGQQSQEEQDVVYAQMLQELKQTRAAVRSSISKASTISDEEHQLALTEDDFLAIQWKMDKIDQKLNDLYRNWQMECKNAITPKDCEEVKRFYKPYLEKYESKYRIFYKCSNKQIDRQIILVCLLLRSISLILHLVWLPWTIPKH